MASATKKSAEQMNQERRAAKQRQKRGTGSAKNAQPAFSMTDAKQDAIKRARAQQRHENWVNSVLSRADHGPVVLNLNDNGDLWIFNNCLRYSETHNWVQRTDGTALFWKVPTTVN